MLEVWFALSTSGALAQSFGDTAAPLLNGDTKSTLVYTFPGVLNIGTLATVVSCTSIEKEGGADVTFGVEFWSNGGLVNDLTTGTGVESLTPGDTDNIATQATVALPEENVATGAITVGAGRIFASSTKIICTAFLVDAANSPPNLISVLPVFKKTKQLGG